MILLVFLSCISFVSRATSQITKVDGQDYVPPAFLKNTSYSIVSYVGLQETGVAVINGTVWVWGNRKNGQAGDGSKDHSYSESPTKVTSISNIVSLVGTLTGMLAIDDNGNLWSWGYQMYGELGCQDKTISGSINNITSPCLVLTDVEQVISNDASTMALDKSGNIWTWGVNAWGQLGRPEVSTWGTNVPGKVDLASAGISSKVKVLGYHYIGFFIVTEDGQVYGWGDNGCSSLSLSSTITTAKTPTYLPALSAYGSQIVSIYGGYDWAVALLSNGKVIGWGDKSGIATGVYYDYQNNGSNSVCVSDPQVISFGSSNVKIEKLYARYRNTVALSTKGEIYTWGQTPETYSSTETPIFLYGTTPTKRQTTGRRVTDISVGREYVYYWNEVGDMYGVGMNDQKQILASGADMISWPGVQLDYDELFN